MTNTIISSTKKDLTVWEQYIDCMMEGYSIRRASEMCGINKSTAFEWRHKILDALQNMAESVKLDGTIEDDETFFPISLIGEVTMKELGYIDYDILLPNKLPTNILEQLNKLEYYNREGDSVCYYDRWDDLIILAKNAMVAGVLSKKSWETIEKRFWYKAELACQME